MSEKEVVNMNNRLYNNDSSLNNIISEDGAEIGEFIESGDILP